MKYHIQKKKKKRILLVLQLKGDEQSHNSQSRNTLCRDGVTSRANFSRNLESKCNIIDHQNITKKKLLPSPLQLKSHDGRGQW